MYIRVPGWHIFLLLAILGYLPGSPQGIFLDNNLHTLRRFAGSCGAASPDQELLALRISWLTRLTV